MLEHEILGYLHKYGAHLIIGWMAMQFAIGFVKAWKEDIYREKHGITEWYLLCYDCNDEVMQHEYNCVFIGSASSVLKKVKNDQIWIQEENVEGVYMVDIKKKHKMIFKMYTPEEDKIKIEEI